LVVDSLYLKLFQIKRISFNILAGPIIPM